MKDAKFVSIFKFIFEYVTNLFDLIFVYL